MGLLSPVGADRDVQILSKCNVNGMRSARDAFDFPQSIFFSVAAQNEAKALHV